MDMITLEGRRGYGAETWGELGLSRAKLMRFLSTAREAVGLRGEVDVLLAEDGRLRQLNREFRGKDKATDVLSFPAAEEVAGEHAGDLAISLETAERQAREHGHSLGDEVRVLLLHGLLHLSGMDHETDKGEMAAAEAELRARLRLRDGLIARVEGVGRPAGLKESRFPSGVTERRATATARTTTKAKKKVETKAGAKATAKAKAGLRSASSFESRDASWGGVAAAKKRRTR